MKDSLFELLLTLFEQTLSQLKATELSMPDLQADKAQEKSAQTEELPRAAELLRIQSPKKSSMRVFTYEEQFKLTKASYQFMMRLLNMGVIEADAMEVILHQLMFSGSSFISLQETKWAIRNYFAPRLNNIQLEFLDLLLYGKEDGHIIH